MKKFLMVLFLFALSFTLFACGNDNGPQEPADPSSGDSDPQKPTSIVSFLGAKEIRIDLMGDLGVSFNYGNQVVTSTTKMTYNANNKITISGTPSKDLNFVVVVEKEPKLGSTEDTTTVIVNKAIEASQLVEYLNDFDYLAADTYRAYIAISTGATTWTKNLNAEMDARIQRLVDVNIG